LLRRLILLRGVGGAPFDLEAARMGNPKIAHKSDANLNERIYSEA
jgi:hypothetical protein